MPEVCLLSHSVYQSTKPETTSPIAPMRTVRVGSAISALDVTKCKSACVSDKSYSLGWAYQKTNAGFAEFVCLQSGQQLPTDIRLYVSHSRFKVTISNG